MITLEIAKLTDTPGYSSLIAVIYTLAFLLICGLISAIVSYIYIRRGYNKQLELASFDLLTGAYNIFKFKKELSNISFKEKEVTLIALNIRDFHYLNEIAGNGTELEHSVRLLKYLAPKLTHSAWYDNSVPCNGLALLEYSLEQPEHGINCLNKSKILEECCLALGSTPGE